MAQLVFKENVCFWEQRTIDYIVQSFIILEHISLPHCNRFRNSEIYHVGDILKAHKINVKLVNDEKVLEAMRAKTMTTNSSN